MSNSTAVATRPDEPTTILQYMAQRRTRIEPMLPEGVRFERVCYDVQEAFANQPQLHECTLDSVFRCVVRSQALGLQIGRTTHLVPKGKRCQLWNDYRGDVELAVRARAIRYAETAVVHKNEHFRIARGTSPQIEHEVIADASQRGPMIGAYAILWITMTRFVAHYMPVEDVDVIRKTKSQQWKSGVCPPWYAEKTVVRQALKLVPQNPQLAKWMAEVEALEDDAVSDDELPVLAPATLPAHARPPALAAPAYGDESNDAWDRVGEALRDGPRDTDPYNLSDPALPLDDARRGTDAVRGGL